MPNEIDILRQQAARARALLAAVSDPLTVDRLRDYATECDAAADHLEAAALALEKPLP